MKISQAIGMLTLAITLSACSMAKTSVQHTQSSSASASSYSLSQTSLRYLSRYYENKDIGVSFYYPAEYAFIGTNLQGTMQVQDAEILYKEVHVLTEENAGEPVAIQIMVSTDSNILKYAAQYHPLETVTVNGIKVQKFQFDGVGSPTGFIQKVNGKYIVIEFDFAPTEEVMEEVLESLRIL